MIRKRSVLVVSMVMITLLAGCSTATKGKTAGESTKPGDSGASQEPVTLTIAMTGAGAEVQFKEQYSENADMKKKFPFVTFEYVNVADLEKLVATGSPPDIVNVTPSRMYGVLRAGLGYDMTALIKKYNFDLGKYTPEQLEAAKNYSKKGELLALPGAPFKYSFFGLAYNKDIFDKFAIPYPKDGMTWDQTIELAKAFNRTEGGIPYHGLVIPQSGLVLSSQRAAYYLDQNGKANLTSSKWVDIFNVIKKAVTTQNDWVQAATGTSSMFMKDKNVAMYAGVLHDILNNAESLEGQLNWDMVSFPSFSDAPGVVPAQGGYLAITSTAKNKDVAFQVVEALLQQDNLKREFENQYVLKRNLNALKNKHMSPYLPMENEPATSAGLLMKEIGTMNTKGTDVNTALRDLQDQIQKAYDAEQAKSK